MLLEFGAENFLSFKEGFEISFQKSKNSKESIANIIAIKGANASGKTNVLEALFFLQDFTLNSFSNLKPKDTIDISSFFKNEDPITLYAIFLDNKIEYKYELILTNEKIISETIWKRGQREVKILERNENSITAIKEYDELKTINLNRKNASIISSAKQYGIEQIDIIYSLFENIITNIALFGKSNFLQDITIDKNLIKDVLSDISQNYFENKKALDLVVKFMKKADIGISNIVIEKRKDIQTGQLVYFPIFHYEIGKDNKLLILEEQSSGTQSLYLQLQQYMNILDSGGVLVLDEFDMNLHPDLLPMLLNLFENQELNPKNAQLILTTHNYDIMDRLGKYKTVLVNKVDNESFLYRLDEIPGDIIRNDRPISPIYNANKIGGKPRIKA